MKGMRHSELLATRNRLRGEIAGQPYRVAILSNVIINQAKDIFEYALLTENVNAQLIVGDYDNILQDAAKYHASNLVIVFWEACNVVNGFQYRAETMGKTEMDALAVKIRGEIDFLIDTLKTTPLVLMNRFTPLLFTSNDLRPSAFERFCDGINSYVERQAPANVLLVDIEKVIARVSVAASADMRFFYSSKALYTLDFLKEYVEYVMPAVRSVCGKSRKALIFDCDNTLWKGVIGEDGLDGIKGNRSTTQGAIYEEVQHLALTLKNKGILLGICSKNNPADVDEALNTPGRIAIGQNDLAIKKVNWEDKVSNLKAIAAELNIGVDSMVFVDDSDFEGTLVEQYLPQTQVIRVPKLISGYPGLMRDKMPVFFNISASGEDRVKTQMYHAQQSRENEKTNFANMDEYLASLGLKVRLVEKDATQVPRIAQLTQKTNQFNLTTKRYTEADIGYFMERDSFLLFSFDVEDKFGKSGTVGVAIVELRGTTANVDTFLMSCRVLGRNVEYAVFDHIVNRLKEKGITNLTATYIKTLKNAQVSDFYNDLGFNVVDRSADTIYYDLKINEYIFRDIGYLEVEFG